jgi:hypothetical protein
MITELITVPGVLMIPNGAAQKASRERTSVPFVQEDEEHRAGDV